MKRITRHQIYRTLVLVPLVAGAHSMLGAPAVVDISKLPAPVSREVDFVRDVRPIFEKNCLKCHGAEKPKGGFRLDARELALAGGDEAKDILPSDSAHSPLIHYVARVVPDMEMPPAQKGEPLTSEEVSILRKWIDSGALWGGEPPSKLAFSVTPSIRWITVQGNASEFRHNTGMKEGLSYGIDRFTLKEQIDPKTKLTIDGRALPHDEDYALKIDIDRSDVGYVHAGVQTWRRWYDNTGGRFSDFSQPVFFQSQELYQDQGKAWIEFGLTPKDLPQISLGYEYDFREGSKSTLQWGSVSSFAPPFLVPLETRNIFPGFKDISEHEHVVKLDLDYDVPVAHLHDSMRVEFADIKTARVNVDSASVLSISPSVLIAILEQHRQVSAVNTFTAEKAIYDWLFVSGGYLYSYTDADAAFRQFTYHSTGIPLSGSSDFWRSQGLVLRQNNNILNLNTRLGPWKDFTFSAGVESEWITQEGLGNVSYDTGTSALFVVPNPALLNVNQQKLIVQEMAGLHYTGIPFTVLFADLRLEQQSVGEFENELGGTHEFLRDTAASSQKTDWKIGFDNSPNRWMSIGSSYRDNDVISRYNHVRDLGLGGAPGDGYPAFITGRDIGTHEVQTKVTLRPTSWLRTTLTHGYIWSDYDSKTDPVAGLTPGGPIHSADFQAQSYGISIGLQAGARLHIENAYTFYSSRMVTPGQGLNIVTPYKGRIHSLLSTATFEVNTNTSLSATYSFSHSGYGQDNASAGLPVGVDYDLHSVQASISRRWRKDITTSFGYGFYHYSEPDRGGENDYNAHALFASMTYTWK
ncbi:MAG: Planctomycete cytochrome [Verrucomicrobiales bacterium]|nr:Planctomycete cytochrome [Verrucomicrobiales bacterium]